MKSFAENCRVRWLPALFLPVLFASAVAGQTNEPNEKLPMVDVVMPLEVYEDGTVKTRVLAGRARIPAAGDIVAVDAKIEFYAPDGTLESRVVSERFRYDRQKGVATSDGRVRYERKGATISGEGFEWHAGEQYVKILNNAKVVFYHREIKGLRSRLKRPEKE